MATRRPAGLVPNRSPAAGFVVVSVAWRSGGRGRTADGPPTAPIPTKRSETRTQLVIDGPGCSERTRACCSWSVARKQRRAPGRPILTAAQGPLTLKSHHHVQLKVEGRDEVVSGSWRRGWRRSAHGVRPEVVSVVPDDSGVR